MPTLPQLFQEDISALDRALEQLLRNTEATTAIVIDKGGFLITQCGDTGSTDSVTLAALAAASYAATQTIASLVSETNFSSLYQQGEQVSLLTCNVDEYCLMAIVFRAGLSVGAIKYYAASTIKAIAAQLQEAAKRNPSQGIDLSMLNVADTSAIFQRKLA
jgi:predicted regulator of Ras-like GTPase activity (Roadblock/LC7/MglB family)